MGVYGLSCLYSSDLPTSSQAKEYKPFHGRSFIMSTEIIQFPLVEEHFFLRWIYAETLLGNECKICSWQIVWPLDSIYKPIGFHLNCIYLVFLFLLLFYGHVVYFLQITSEISFVIFQLFCLSILLKPCRHIRIGYRLWVEGPRYFDRAKVA